jgi:6-phosphogluconolactonase
VASAEIIVREDPSELAVEASDFILREINSSTAELFCLALTGGTTPVGSYRELAGLPVDWSRVAIFWSDDRHVPLDDPNSNFRAAREALLDHIEIPADRVHRIPTEMEADEAAAAYESEVRRVVFGSPVPRFDLLLLGIGTNGHTASIFPGEPEAEEAQRLVVATKRALITDDGPSLRRITFTFPLINAAHVVAFIAAGEAKARVVAAAVSGAESKDVTASHVNPAGRLVWLLDRGAASQL